MLILTRAVQNSPVPDNRLATLDKVPGHNSAPVGYLCRYLCNFYVLPQFIPKSNFGFGVTLGLHCSLVLKQWQHTALSIYEIVASVHSSEKRKWYAVNFCKDRYKQSQIRKTGIHTQCFNIQLNVIQEQISRTSKETWPHVIDARSRLYRNTCGRTRGRRIIIAFFYETVSFQNQGNGWLY